MNRGLKRVRNLGAASAMFVLSLASPVWAEHVHWRHHWGAPEMNLGTAGNALLLVGGVLLLLTDHYRSGRTRADRNK
jgi:hypothetical protein